MAAKHTARTTTRRVAADGRCLRLAQTPSAQTEKLLYNFLLQATSAVPGLQVVLTAGNHDSAGRLEAPAELLKQHNIYVRGTIRMDGRG